jgi:hypothetical protein
LDLARPIGILIPATGFLPAVTAISWMRFRITEKNPIDASFFSARLRADALSAVFHVAPFFGGGEVVVLR